VRGRLESAPTAEDVIEVTSLRYAEGLTTRVALRGDGRVSVTWQGAALSRPRTVEYAVEGPEKELLHDAFHVAVRDGLLDARDARNRLAVAEVGEARYDLNIAGRRNTFRTVNASPERTLALQRIAGYFLAQGWRRQKGEPNLREALGPTRPTCLTRPTGPTRPTLKTSPAP